MGIETKNIRIACNRPMRFYLAKMFRSKPDSQTKLLYVRNLTTQLNLWLSDVEYTIYFSHISENRGYDMAKKKAAQQPFGDIRFCTIQLDTEGKVLAKQWITANNKDLDTYFDTLIRDGWKTSLTFDEYNDCFIASSTQRDEDDRNHNVCLTSRSDNMYEAIMLNVYKLYIMYEGKKLPTEKQSNNWG